VSRRAWLGAVALAVSAATVGASQTGTGAVPLRTMLREAYDLVRRHYYDPAFHGLDWEARYKEFDARIRGVTSVNAGLAVVAQFLDGLKDSHTYFLPPSRPFDHDYGYRLRVVGERVFVSRVVDGTDAAAKLARGDEVLSLNGFVPSRQGLFTMLYILDVLAPVETVQLTVRSPTGVRRNVLVNAKIVERPKRLTEWEPWAILRTKDDPTKVEPQRYASLGDVLVWSMPDFTAEDRIVDGMWERARRHRALILDLRSNPGGYVTTLGRMLGYVFDRNGPAFEFVSRKGRTPFTVTSRGNDRFQGELIVLLDSWSASAAELFARIVQLERKGVVLGDRSLGGVMVARAHPGESRHLFYGFSITESDAVMSDGRTLERTGVVPDETVLPTPADLAEGTDPVLSRAAARVGVTLDPKTAARIFDPK
jgi:C-terminal processing protease CtpA/Prc